MQRGVCSVCVVASVTLNSVDLHICKLRSLSSQVNFLKIYSILICKTV